MLAVMNDWCEKISISRKDCLDLDQMLAKVIHTSLVEYKKHVGSSIPNGCDSTEEWHANIDLMIEGFASLSSLQWDGQASSFEIEKEALSIFAEHFRDLWA